MKKRFVNYFGLFAILMFILILSLPNKVEAASKPKINKTKVTLTHAKNKSSYNLKVSRVPSGGKVIWSVASKKVARVFKVKTTSSTSIYKVVSIAKGNTTVFAKVYNKNNKLVKKLKCSVKSKKKHKYKSKVVKKATCANKGLRQYSCSCGATYSISIAKTQTHSFIKQIPTAKYLKSAATTSSAAVYYYACSVCGAKGTSTYAYGSLLPKALTFNEVLLNTIGGIEDLGGYWTKKTIDGTTFEHNAWVGMDLAFVLNDDDAYPTIDLSYARPSFCSSACYMALLKALLNWDTTHIISRQAWINLKPYTVAGHEYAIQDDGVGCWGRANANGPGLAVLVNELGAGENLYIGLRDSYSSDNDYLDLWEDVKAGDFLKIFWNDMIGYDSSTNEGEKGHMVIFLGRTKAYNSDGKRDDIITYWSSNGTNSTPNKGYSIETTRMSNIIRAVRTRITKPALFNHADSIAPTAVQQWLYDIAESRLGTEDELKQYIGVN